MLKRIIALVAALAVVFTAGAVVLSVTVAGTIKSNAQTAALKAENEKAYIADLFHDQGHIYMTPDEPKSGETVTLRLRTVRYNVTRAQIQYTADKGVSWTAVDMKFEKQDDTGYYDIFKGEIPAQGELIYYRFIAGNADLYNTVYYDTKGVAATEGSYNRGWQIVPGHDVPDWAKGALWYSVMPDAFYNGNTMNDKRISGNNTYVTWNKLRKGLRDRYGGDLAGIEEKLDYIESLNVDAIYMNPVSKSYQNAGYGSVHFDEIESALGNEEDFVRLADAVHSRNLKLMGDVVLTFAVEDSYYFNKRGYWPVVGAYQSQDSLWTSMFKFYNWPDNYMIGWNSPSIDINTEAAKNLYYANENSYLLKYANLFDGYRFDCGGWLWGTTDTEDLKAYTFIKEIRKALRSVNDDFYLLSESDWTNMNTGTWDSAWNISYMPKLQDYAKGLINETIMADAMYSLEMTIPRNVALCLENMICDHDSYRVVQHDDYMYNAAALIQMTYLGSPCIFYGEELDYVRENEDGIGTTQSFYSIDWDESNWDQARLNFYKATSELRKAYPCVKTGVVNMLSSDIANNTLTFGRWDKDGAAITVASQNEDVLTVEIPVKNCDIKNGTVMTDWYTGAQYIVKDGKITADIIPGGTVIVTGKKASSYRQTFEQVKVGSVSSKSSVLTKNTASFTVSGKGSINGSADNVLFSNTVAFNDFSVYANIRGDGAAALMIRNGVAQKDTYYAACVNNGRLEITARTAYGAAAKTLVSEKCTKNTYVKLCRSGANEFTAYRTEVTDGNLGAWEKIDGAEASIGMNNRVNYGFAPLKGETRVNNVTCTALDGNVTYDTFDGEVNAALFDNINAGFVSVDGGSLTITNTAKSKLHYLLTNSMDDDWTFKAKMSFAPAAAEYAGVVCRQDDNNYIVAGRTKIGDRQMLFIGKSANGSIAVYGSAEDPLPDGDIIIQLQRAGAYYSAVYSADNGASWGYIGKLYTNFSYERVGILVAGSGSASFDWVSFGDSIKDGVSVNTPHSPVNINVEYTNRNTEGECAYEYLTGSWSVVTGGWNQRDKSVFAQASATNKLFAGLYAETTVDISDGDGWAGIAFGKTTPYTGENDGFHLKYYDNGTLVLFKRSEKVAECKLNVQKSEAMRLVVEAQNGRITVYAGQKATPVMSVNNTGYYNGYVSFCSNGVISDFRNFHCGSTDASWNWVSGTGTGWGNMITTVDNSSTERQIHTICTLAGYSFTDFICTAKLSVNVVNDELPSASGLLLCASEGKSASTDGVFVHLDGSGRLVLSVAGSEKGEYKLPENSVSVTVLVVKQNGSYKVFLNGVPEPVLEYTESFNRGGVLSAYTINGRGAFSNIAIENLQPDQDYTKTNTAQSWSRQAYTTFADSFNSAASENGYAFYNTEAGKFAVTDGALKCYESTDWTAGATVMNCTYADFTMEFRARIDNSQSGWMSVGMRKSDPTGNHNNSGFSLMIGRSGSVFFFDSEAQKEYGRAQISNYETGGWYDFKIVARGSAVTVYVNGVKLSEYSDTKYFEGFISFTSGKTDFSVDDLRIAPIR